MLRKPQLLWSIASSVCLFGALTPTITLAQAGNETRAGKCDRLGDGDRDWIAQCEALLAEQSGKEAENVGDFLANLYDREAWRDGRMFDRLTDSERSQVYNFFVIDLGELGYAEWACKTGRLPHVNSDAKIWSRRFFSASMQELAWKEHVASLELNGVGNSLAQCDLDRLGAARIKIAAREQSLKRMFAPR